MRHIIAVLIALLVLLPLIFAAGAQQTTTTSSSTSSTAASTAQLAPVSPKTVSQVVPPQTGIDTTQSIAAFLNDNWLPPTYAAPVQTAVAGNGTAANATANSTALANAQFLADSSVQNSYQAPVNVAESANKNGVRQQSSYAILDFLNDNWTPGMAQNQAQFVDLSSAGYSMHRMS